MKFVGPIKTAAFLLSASLLVLSCSKKYAYDFQDGTPGDGASGPNVTVDTSIRTVDVSKYPQARVFPGLVCSSEPRLNNLTVAMDLKYNFVGTNLRISVPPQPLFSTGLYAAPGELVIIDVPSGLYSLAVQIGLWSDNLSSIVNAPRDPLIYSRMQLAPGRNYIRNLYGGHIYIDAAVPIATPVNLVFTNVVKSPDFVLGVTSNAQWQAALQASCVPFLELRSKNMIFTVPRDYCISRPIADPTALMTEWDNAINFDYYQWEGLEANPANPLDQAPLLPWRVVQDIKPSVGYGHNGYPIVTYNDYGWFDEFTKINQIRNADCWGTFHELGHNNQQGTYWSWSTLGEVTCNLFSFKVANRQSATYPTAWPPKHPSLNGSFANALAFALSNTAGKNFDGTDARINEPFARLTPFIQIFDKVPTGLSYNSWGFMSHLYKEARRAPRISLTDQDKRDFFYEKLCGYTQRDWRLFFKAWGIQISNISLNKMALLYPEMDQEISTYNPLTRTGGTENSYYYRRNWSSITTNSWATNEPNATVVPVTRLLDADFTTYWHSNYGTGTGPQNPNANTTNPRGFWIAVDMGKSLPVKGLKIALRQSGSGVTTVILNLKVEVSNDNTNWTIPNFATVSPAGPGFIRPAEIQGMQSFNFASNQTFRYFRVSIPTNADNKNNGTSSALAEIDVIQP